MSQNEKGTNALLASWFHVGEEVSLNPLTHAPAYVRGFGEHYIGRGGFTHKLAGIYIDFMNVLVAPKNAGQSVQSMGAEQLIRLHFPSLQGPQRHDQFQAMKALKIRIGDLPDTPFWVGDVVRRGPGDLSCRIVKDILYIDHAAGRNEPIYDTVREKTPNAVEMEYESSLTLIERGNIWKLEHNEPLSFASLDEEADFYKSLGMSSKILGRVDGGLWHLWAGIQQLQAGEADQLIVKDKKTQLVVLIKYDNEEFGSRMRAAELARLGC